jgi:hypothetical protein
LFTYNDPVHTQFPDDQTVAQSGNAGALLGKDSAQSAQGKVATERLVDLSTQASPAPLPAGGSGDVSKDSTSGRSLKRDACCARDRHLAGSFTVLAAVVDPISQSTTGPNNITPRHGQLRVAGLSKSDAEALCSRMKDDGGNCSVVR